MTESELDSIYLDYLLEHRTDKELTRSNKAQLKMHEALDKYAEELRRVEFGNGYKYAQKRKKKKQEG